MKTNSPEQTLPERAVVFKSYWDTGGGPNFNGFIQVVKITNEYWVESINNSDRQFDNAEGPFESLTHILSQNILDLTYVGPGTCEIICPSMTPEEIVTFLKVYNPGDEEETTDSWKVLINEQLWTVSDIGFQRSKAKRRKKN